MDPLEALGFNLVGFGCTTCIGNSGPLAEPIAAAVEETDLVGVSVLSGNRNFEGRIHPLTRASYLASPPLVVAFALAGRIDLDLTTEPLGTDAEGASVYLADLWPTVGGGRQGGRRAGAVGDLPPGVRIGVRWGRSLAGAAGAGGWAVRLGRGLDLRGAAAVLRWAGPGAGAAGGHRGRAGAGLDGGLGHHRPHLTGGLHPAEQPRRASG